MDNDHQGRLFLVSFKGRDHFFQSKFAAKKFVAKHDLKGVVIHRGPDHWLGASDGTSFQMEKQGRKK